MQAQSPAADGQVTLLTPSGYQHASCGYCKSKTKLTRASIGALSASLQPLHYQTFVDRGWRRSGAYLYMPDCRRSCCPHYTIRLDAAAFDPTKDQRKAVNRWSQYILGQDYKTKAARLCPRTRQEKKWRRNKFDLSDSLHACEYQNVKKPLDPRMKETIEPAHRFEITLEADKFTEEKYALFANYQKMVHGESESSFSKNSFRSFLCSGMKQSIKRKQGVEQRLGSYHQCYRLDGRLVAMGVLDLLPECVSSVYLIYHKDVSHWNFGKLSALREIDFALQGGYKLYYMGYYIHSCVKMRYKGAFKPTYVLDPESYTWDLLDSDLLQRMSARKYVSMSREREYKIPIELPPDFPRSDSTAGLNYEQNEDLGLEILQSLCEYLTTPRPDQAAGPEKRYRSVFEAGTPGVLSLEDVDKEINLGEWELKLGDIIVTLEDLVSWHESKTSDPSSIKGIAAELAACIGPDLVKQTMLEFR